MPLAYTLPQVVVFQEFSQIAAEIVNPLRAWIIGPNAQLFRYAVAAEKELVLVGSYDPAEDTAYSWPNQPAGSVVDQSYAQVFVDNALLQYFEDPIGTGSVLARVAGYTNRLRSDTLAFQTANNVNRSAAFHDRDVAIGDIATIRDNLGNALTTYIHGILFEPTAPVTGATVAAVSNATVLSARVTASQIAGDINRLQLVTDGHLFNGLVAGALSDVYTIKVTVSSAGGDLTTARVSIQTSSGIEFLTNVSPAALNATGSIGNRGLLAGWRLSSDSESDTVGADAKDLLVGQTWQVAVQQTFAVPTATSAGTFVGPTNDTYVVTVGTGGLFSNTANPPQISVRSAIGTDGAQNVPVTGVSTPVAIGSYGATIAFSGAGVLGLRKGDTWSIPVTAAGFGRASTLLLGNNLSSSLLSATDLDLSLAIQKNITLPNFHTTPSPGFNWQTSATQITLLAGVEVYDPSYTAGGVQLPLPLIGGQVYVQYRAWLNNLVNGISALSDISQIGQIPGPLDPDNPLSYAVSKAVANSNGTLVQYCAVSDPSSLAAWTKALGLGTNRADLYRPVLLSLDSSVQALGVSHVQAMSSPQSKKWRGIFVPLVSQSTTARVDAALSANSAAVLATIIDDPASTGTQYTLVVVTSGNASLLALGVQASDLLRTNFATDSNGDTVYDEYVISTVVNEDMLLLQAGPNTPVNVAQRIEIYHTNADTELATQLGLQAGAYNSMRVCAIWRDAVTSGGVTVPMYHLCAALAGLASGVVPHQDLTNVAVSGFDQLTSPLFTSADMDALAAFGVWIVTDDTMGNIYTRDALTTDMSTPDSSSEMLLRNTDSISYYVSGVLAPYIGRSNVVKSALNQMQQDVSDAFQFLQSNGFTTLLGAQLISGTITALNQSVVSANKVILGISLDLPRATKEIDVQLTI